MSQSCPHCGIALLAFIDAYCPRCRGELAVAPVDLARPANLEPAPDADCPGVADKIISTAGSVAHVILAVVGLIVAVSIFVGAGRESLRGEIEKALAFTLFGALWAGWAWSKWRDARGEKASVSGREKTQASENEPK